MATDYNRASLRTLASRLDTAATILLPLAFILGFGLGAASALPAGQVPALLVGGAGAVMFTAATYPLMLALRVVAHSGIALSEIADNACEQMSEREERRRAA